MIRIYSNHAFDCLPVARPWRFSVGPDRHGDFMAYTDVEKRHGLRLRTENGYRPSFASFNHTRNLVRGAELEFGPCLVKSDPDGCPIISYPLSHSDDDCSGPRWLSGTWRGIRHSVPVPVGTPGAQGSDGPETVKAAAERDDDLMLIALATPVSASLTEIRCLYSEVLVSYADPNNRARLFVVQVNSRAMGGIAFRFALDSSKIEGDIAEFGSIRREVSLTWDGDIYDDFVFHDEPSHYAPES